MNDKDKNLLNEKELNETEGGSWFITEEDGKAAGLELKNIDGTEGSWGYLYNSGDYYWKGHALTETEANAIVMFTKDTGKQPKSITEATEKYKPKW